MTRKEFRDLNIGDMIESQSLCCLVVNCDIDDEDRHDPTQWQHCNYTVRVLWVNNSTSLFRQHEEFDIDIDHATAFFDVVAKSYK